MDGDDMQVRSTQSLLEHVLDVVPQAFFEQFAARQQLAYEEANTAMTDPRWRPTDGRLVRGFMKRALIEQNARNAAEQAALKWDDVEFIGGRTSCVHVYAENLRITVHRVPTPWSFVPPCESRRQDAAANRFLDGYVLEGALCAPLPKIRDASEIRMYVLHGASFKRGELTNFLNLVVPDSELKAYCWQKTFAEIQQAYAARAKATTATATKTQTPRSKLKTIAAQVGKE